MYETHELAGFLPVMRAADYERLRDDIEKNGLHDPIVLYEDKILDGIHRERACDELGIEPEYEDYIGDDPARYVFSKNLSRRHLTTSQLAMVGARLEEHFAGKRGRPKKNSRRSAGNTPKSHNEAAEKAAEIVGTSARSISRAKRVILKRPDLAEKVKSGEMAINAADEEIRTDKRKGRKPEPEPESDPEPKPEGKSKNWDGKSNAKRTRELKQRKRNGVFTNLLSLQIEMAKVCVVLEDYEPDDFELSIATLNLIDDFYDDLINLDIWCNKSLMATQGWLSAVKIRDKIAKLRNVNGRKEGEAELYLQEADKLERKLEMLLAEGVLT